MARVGVVGSRDWPVLELVRAYVRAALKPGDILVSGGARGVDITAEREAKAIKLNVWIYYARWDLHGRGAGYARNLLIVANSDRLAAFHLKGTRGTAHTISAARGHGKVCDVVEYWYGCVLHPSRPLVTCERCHASGLEDVLSIGSCGSCCRDLAEPVCPHSADGVHRRQS